MEVVWAIMCRWCGGWFYICTGCYHGERYCDDECRGLARDEQCRRAQAKYLKKLAGRERRAAATAACRESRRRGVPPRRGRYFAESNRSGSLPRWRSMFDSLPKTARCMRCGRRGPVQVGPP